MYQYINYFGEEITRLETSDYQVGEYVIVKNNRGTCSRVPQYLNGDKMRIVRIGRKNLKITGKKYPGEFWYADPNEVEKEVEYG